MLVASMQRQVLAELCQCRVGRASLEEHRDDRQAAVPIGVHEVRFENVEFRLGTLEELPVWAKLVNGLVLSVSPRTAGFNNIDYGQATVSTNFLTILFMAVGGSPGSTAGGLKTTTIALIGLLAWARLRGRDLIHLWGRSVPAETVQRAVGLFVLAFGLMTACIFIFTTTEIGNLPHGEVESGLLSYMFEVVSAFNTVGLSMGVTGGLTTAASFSWMAASKRKPTCASGSKLGIDICGIAEILHLIITNFNTWK